MVKERVLSGIQATGTLTMGNYLGAIRNWVRMQDDHQCLFFVVDLHALTVRQEPEKLRQACLNNTASYIACGIDPKKSAIFIQSHVHEHAELNWILGCITPLGWLNRMTQFKDKSGKNKENAGLGLYAYPVLQAADILIYNAKKVPVGEDQKQHIELARDIAQAFNRNYEIEHFTIPDPVMNQQALRIMSLRDGTKKMSKSDESDYSRINLTDDADLIAQKIRKAKTDAIPEIYYNKEERPEISNLLNIYSILSGINIKEVEARFVGKGTAQFKEELTQVLVQEIAPIANEMVRIKKDPGYVEKVLQEGAEQARAIAQKNLAEVKRIVGLVASFS
jgi:tryptophanyl-tRNA synthetase